MEEYINISLDCSPFLSKILDLRVPTELTIKELLQIVSDTYGIGVKVMNPSVSSWRYQGKSRNSLCSINSNTTLFCESKCH